MSSAPAMKRPASGRANPGVSARPGPRCLLVLLALLAAQGYLSYTSHHQPAIMMPSTSTSYYATANYYSLFGSGVAGGGPDHVRQTTSLSPSQNALNSFLSEGLVVTNKSTSEYSKRQSEDGSNNKDGDDDRLLPPVDPNNSELSSNASSSLLDPIEDDNQDDSVSSVNASSLQFLDSGPTLPAALQSFPYNHTFPRWGDANEGIDFCALLQFVDGLVEGRATTLPADLKDFPDVFPEVLHVWGGMSAPPRAWLAERLRANRTTTAGGVSVVADGVYVSGTLRKRTTRRQIRHRVVPVEKFLQRAWMFLAYHAMDPVAQKRWPLLLRTMISSASNNATIAPGIGMGFPIIVWHGDYRGCNHLNFQRNTSIPLFTTCARVSCSHSIPFPTYRTISDSLPTPHDWDAVFEREAITNPWGSKIAKLVWRGGLTGPLDNYLSPRGRLGVFAAKHKSHPLLDVGIHHIPPRHYHPNSNRTSPANLARRIHMKPPMPAANFSQYKAILDTDGNSWSSRFGRLLCANSVIVKVEPHYVDFFYRHLEPWRHYVPVRHDLSNLLEVVEWVLDEANERHVLQIVAAAQRWCRRHMTHGAMVHDMLDVLNSYVSYLDRGDSEWSTTWKESVGRLWDPSSKLAMQKLSYRLPVIRTNFTLSVLKQNRTNPTNRTAVAAVKGVSRRNATLRSTVSKVVSSLNGTYGGAKALRRSNSTAPTGKKKRFPADRKTYNKTTPTGKKKVFAYRKRYSSATRRKKSIS
jgi:Glycosyl transferase family 90